MKSNRRYHYFFKYSLLGGAVVLSMLALISWLAPNVVKLDRDLAAEEITSATILILVAALSFLLFLLIKNRFAMVELSEQTITIHHNGNAKRISWLDVEQIGMLQFITPPLYTLRTKNSHKSYWFNTEPQRGLGGFMSDKSEMGKLIEKKKNELGI